MTALSPGASPQPFEMLILLIDLGHTTLSAAATRIADSRDLPGGFVIPARQSWICIGEKGSPGRTRAEVCLCASRRYNAPTTGSEW